MSFSLLTSAGKAQNAPPKEAPPPPQVNPATQAAIAAQAAQIKPEVPKNTGPDYPEPRSLTVGIYYLAPYTLTEPGFYGGSQATTYGTLTALGKPRKSPGAEVILPITRTGEIHLEIFRIEGTGNQNAPASTTVLGTLFNQGDYLATRYDISGGKIYLDDLLFPHKFPVERFRLKSLWEFQYVSIGAQVNAPFVPLPSSGVAEYATGGKNIILPTFGLAAEYALTPHLLLRADASGFGILHKADIWDANARVAYRRGPVEFLVGAKIFHGKSTPNNAEYVSVTLAGAFVGVQWHSGAFERTK